jgi:catechol 2,3-dioxygenase-like lactoylglutathione lyase family enzyme
MITHQSHTSVYVLDQDSAKAFYTEKLGFELRIDFTMEEDFEGAGAGFRWLTVSPPNQPDLTFGTTCPEGSNRDNQGLTCVNDLTPGPPRSSVCHL